MLKPFSSISGESAAYSELVLALGAELIRPPIGGDAADEVLGVNDLDDYRRFQDLLAARGAKKIAIIGAGLIGCEFANDLLNGGFSVEAVDPMGWCLPTLLPEPSGRAVQAALEEKGATFHFGPLATEVNRSETGYVVSLNNGETIEADAVLCAVGVRPRTALATEAGIQTQRGIVTDRLLQTSAPHVYAMGDCAEVAGHVLVYVAPLMAAARALAATLAGEPTQVSYPGYAGRHQNAGVPDCGVAAGARCRGGVAFEGDAPDIKALFRSVRATCWALRSLARQSNNEWRSQRNCPRFWVDEQGVMRPLGALPQRLKLFLIGDKASNAIAEFVAAIGSWLLAKRNAL